MIERETRRGGAAQRMAHQGEVAPAELGDQLVQIGGEDLDAEITDLGRGLGSAGAAIAHRDRGVAVRRQRLLDQPPDAPRGEEAMGEQDPLRPIAMRQIFELNP